jgi:Tfp pilus assembly protein PilN
MAALPIPPDDKTTSQVKFWTSLVANVGFPILVAGYLLIRVSATLDAINATLIRQQAVLDTLIRTVEQLARR